VDAKKLYADGQGHETPAAMDETVDVGAFDVEPGHTGYDASKVIAVQKVRIHSGVQTISLTVNRPPRCAGIDPFSELIDRNPRRRSPRSSPANLMHYEDNTQ
jgi:ABC-2 type transport system permease protein